MSATTHSIEVDAPLRAVYNQWTQFEEFPHFTLAEEVVNVGKRTVSAGDIKIHKKTTTEQVNVPVELKREDAVIERIPAHEVQEGGKEPFQEEHLKIPLSREEPVVEKKTHLTGAVRVRKTEGTEQRTVQENVRHEHADVDESGRTGSKGPESD